MKSIRIFLLPLLLAAIAAACTHNDGDIGPWFGTWAMTGMTVNGETPQDFNPTANVWEFQSELVTIRLLGEHHDIDGASWGTWHEADGHLYLDFTHNSQQSGPGEYDAPAWLMMENSKVIDLTITDRGKRTMVLRYSAPGGQIITYTLKKTW